ncbi:IclR family transcriptional regulator [Granulosicoccus antarcticus]|uniref:Transcriptional regulator KdgR n=1 Tax=Granulosicoccus antarcticus IMCC3135 TaxID=1192854 RepID=A0A2Z2NS17_9GAMM|nr:IclR family transcriptional regulator [Granulosicoccus antarcticus]ASJ74326.1 Transcriptional regulator KdgR [Granulosicoccus antarcticus IMCC3135]
MSQPQERSDKYSAPALSKGLDILEFLASEPEAQKKADIARALDRSISEIFRMLVVLEEREYVAFDHHSERYSLTTKLFEVAHRYPPIRRLSTVSAVLMQALAREVNQSVHMTIRHNTDILVIAQVDSPGNNVTSVRLGARVPIVQTASGAVLTASMDAQELASLEEQLSDQSAKLRKLFAHNRESAAKQGYCECPSMVVEGVINISAPIHDHSGQVIAAVTIPFIRRLNSGDHLTQVQTRKALIVMSKNISHLLGGRLADS